MLEFSSTNVVALAVIVVILADNCVEGRTRHCYTCRSRGPLGDCKDPFTYNASLTEHAYTGVKVTPCASAWCAKIIEGKQDDYDVATERMCLQRPPEDLQERCADTLYKRQKVFMCFCRGDFCNGAPSVRLSFGAILSLVVVSAAMFYKLCT